MKLSAPRAVELPRWAPGQRIGLLGGSFDPAHDGHLMISQLALSRLRLDRVWWLVTPGNPLKSQEHLPDLAARMAAAGALARDPRIAVAGFEAAIGARYTWQTVAWLTRRLPGVRFVWIMARIICASFICGDVGARSRRWRPLLSSLVRAPRFRGPAALRPRHCSAGACPNMMPPVWPRSPRPRFYSYTARVQIYHPASFARRQNMPALENRAPAGHLGGRRLFAPRAK